MQEISRTWRPHYGMLVALLHLMARHCVVCHVAWIFRRMHSPATEGRQRETRNSDLGGCVLHCNAHLLSVNYASTFCRVALMDPLLRSPLPTLVHHGRLLEARTSTSNPHQARSRVEPTLGRSDLTYFGTRSDIDLPPACNGAPSVEDQTPKSPGNST